MITRIATTEEVKRVLLLSLASELKRSRSSPRARDSSMSSAKFGDGSSHWGRGSELIKKKKKNQRAEVPAQQGMLKPRNCCFHIHLLTYSSSHLFTHPSIHSFRRSPFTLCLSGTGLSSIHTEWAFNRTHSLVAGTCLKHNHTIFKVA